jgi:predicted N-acetyltransferase YhbS
LPPLPAVIVLSLRFARFGLIGRALDDLVALDALTIGPLRAAKPADVDALLDRVFGADRRRRTAYRIRDGMTAIADLSFAAFDAQGRLAGSLQCWPAALDGTVPLVLVGPVAVQPELQREGIGRTMMDRMIAAADYIRSDPLVLIGDPEYYGRFFGFEAHWTQDWTVPGPVERRRLLARVPAGMSLPAEGHLGPRR